MTVRKLVVYIIPQTIDREYVFGYIGKKIPITNHLSIYYH